MEVVELFSFSGLDVLWVQVVVGIGRADDSVEQHHPAAGDLLYFLRYLVMHSLPQKFNA